MRYALNRNKIKKELKWKASTEIDVGLKKTFDWYLTNSKFFLSIKKKDITKRLGN